MSRPNNFKIKLFSQVVSKRLKSSSVLVQKVETVLRNKNIE